MFQQVLFWRGIKSLDIEHLQNRGPALYFYDVLEPTTDREIVDSLYVSLTILIRFNCHCYLTCLFTVVWEGPRPRPQSKVSSPELVAPGESQNLSSKLKAQKQIAN